MKNKRIKVTILVVLAVLFFSGLVFASLGGRGRGRGQDPGFGRWTRGRGGMRAQDTDFGRGTRGGRGMRAQGTDFGRGTRGVHDRDTMLMRILHRLDLTDEQTEQIKAIHESNKDKGEAVKKEIAEATKALHEAVAEGADEATIRAAGTKLGNAMSEGAVLKVTTVTSIEKVLTEGQLEKLKELQEKMKERIGQLRERIEDPEFRNRPRQQGAESWMGPPQVSPRRGRDPRAQGRGMRSMGRTNFGPDPQALRDQGQGRGQGRGWNTNRGRARGWGWPEY